MQLVVLLSKFSSLKWGENEKIQLILKLFDSVDFDLPKVRICVRLIYFRFPC